MALFFSTTTDVHFDIAITCDSALDMTQDEKNIYLKSGEGLKTFEGQTPTYFVIKPMSPKDRENVEIKAGAFTRSELGRMLWSEEPMDIREKAYWRENLSDMEKKAISSYEQYINKVYEEMIKSSVIKIKDLTIDPWDAIQQIRPDADRIRTITELVLQIQRLSLLSNQGK